jgi:hypothetical protein
MTLLEFDAAMQTAADIRRHAENLLSIANRIEGTTIRNAGITHVDREAGFPCWVNSKDIGYYSTPREALRAQS